MTIFSTFFKVFRKYAGSFVLYTCIFLLFVIIMVNVNKGNTIETYSASKCYIALFNHNDSSVAKALSDYLSERHIIVETDENIDSFRDELYSRNITYVVTIPENFEEYLEVEVYKLPGSYDSEFMDMTINSFIAAYTACMAGGMDAGAAYSYTVETMNTGCEVSLNSKAASSGYTDEHYYYVFMPYILLMVITQCIAPVLISFNKTDIKKRMLCSALTDRKRNTGLFLGCMVFTIIIILFYSLISIILYRESVFTVCRLFRTLNVITYSVVSVTFAFLISNITRAANMINVFANVVGLGSSFICGVFVPRALLGSGVIAVGRFFPAYWYVNVEEALCNTGSVSYTTIITGYAVQLLFAAAFMTLSLIIYKNKKNSY